jgi:hypothetical protein
MWRTFRTALEDMAGPRVCTECGDREIEKVIRANADEGENMTGGTGECIRCEGELSLSTGYTGNPLLCASCETESLLTGEDGHDNAQLGLDRLDAEEQDRYTVKPVYLTRNERGAVARALREYLDKAGHIRGCPEAELWVRAAWHLMVDVDERLDSGELEPPERIDHESWRQDVAERTGTDSVSGTEVDP